MKCFILFLFMSILSSSTSCAQNPSQSGLSKQEQSKVTAIFLKVKYLENLTLLEKEQIEDALKKLRTQEIERVSVSDGMTTVTYNFSPEFGKIIIESSKNSSLSNQKENDTETAEYLFHEIDEVPVFPGCENVKSEEERKKCTIKKVQEFVKVAFDWEITNKIDFPGIYKNYGQFRINPDGAVQVLSTNAAHPVISQELKRVLSQLPKLIPGRHSDHTVPVLYSFPFVLYVE